MTIIWLGSERESFTTYATTDCETCGDRDATYAREAFRNPGGGQYNTVDLGVGVSPDIAVGVANFYGQGVSGAVGANNSLELLDSGGTARLRLRGTGSNGVWTAERWNGSSWVSIGTGTVTLPIAGTGGFWNFFATGIGTASGGLLVQINGVTLLTAAGEDFSGFTDIQTVRFGHWGGRSDQSEFAIGTTTLGFHRVKTVVANATGTDTDDTGPVANINEGTLNDATYLELTAAGNHRSYKSSARTLTNPAYKGVTVTGRAARVDASGPQQIKPYLLIGGTRYYGTTFALTTGWLNYFYTWDINPATTTAWTASDVNDANLEWGWEAVT